MLNYIHDDDHFINNFLSRLPSRRYRIVNYRSSWRRDSFITNHDYHSIFCKLNSPWDARWILCIVYICFIFFVLYPSSSVLNNKFCNLLEHGWHINQPIKTLIRISKQHRPLRWILTKSLWVREDWGSQTREEHSPSSQQSMNRLLLSPHPAWSLSARFSWS